MVSDRLLRARASWNGIFPLSQSATIDGKFSGSSTCGRPKRTPLTLAAEIPCSWRLRMFSRSLCATKERICSTRSAMNVPIRSVPGVQQGHVQDRDVRLLDFGQNPLLGLDVFIIALQPVDAQNAEQIAGLQFFDHSLILRPVEVLAGLLVREDVLRVYARSVQRNSLPVLVLIRTGCADIAVD